MALLNRIANKEIFDYLRTVTIKSTYFANRARELQIKPTIEKSVPEISNPYVIHLAGEYVLNPKGCGDYIFPKGSKTLTPERFPYTPGDPNYRFAGFRLTKDKVAKYNKNYWNVSDNGLTLVKVPQSRFIDPETQLISDQYSPVDNGLYELQPLVIKHVKDPIGSGYHDIEFPVSQMIFDADGRLMHEAKNSDIFVDGIYDEIMTIRSLDTDETIPFCLQTLHAEYAPDEAMVHTKTLEAYKIPGRYFDNLCKRYPNQVDLIKAIVYPVKSVKISSIMTVPELETLLDSYSNPSSVVYERDATGEDYARDENGNRIVKGVQRFFPFSNKRVISLATKEYIDDLKRRYPNKFDLLKKMGADYEGYRFYDKTSASTMTISEARRTRIVKAHNFEVLEASPYRLDSTERVSLREHLEEFMDMVRKRWAVDEYNFEENYAATLWSLVWTLLPVALIAKRYANIKTPAVSEMHMWDYLTSKGLGNYKGYLTIDQTWFLYKNIQYIFQHRAQQKTLNILIDNILAYYGLTLKSKTVVLDTTKSLDIAEKPASPSKQCETCARFNVSCFRHITNYTCEEWLGTKNLCKAMPIVLTEEFNGASKSKIIRALVNSHGYSEEAALIKYRRSFIWRDDEIEQIKDDFNRDQLVDLSGKVDSLAVTIENEHVNGQEPVVNEDIIEQQTKELQHMNGTYAPTKLLEMTKRQFNSKFQSLFNRFVTETLLRFAPEFDADGNFFKKVICNYVFDTTEGVTEFRLEYGELLAGVYLAFVREDYVDSLVDDILLNEVNGKPLYETITEDGDPRGAKGIKVPAHWVQERLTDVLNNFNYDFAIPTQAKVTTAFKFGRPVLQEVLVDKYFNEYEEVMVGETKARKIQISKPDGSLTINSYLVVNDVLPTSCSPTLDKVAVRGKQYFEKQDDGFIPLELNEGDTVPYTAYEEDSIWSDLNLKDEEGNFIRLRIVDANGNTDEETPIIPKYFRWHYPHLNPDEASFEAYKKETGNTKITFEEYKETLQKEIELAEHEAKGLYEPNEMYANPTKDLNMGFDRSDEEETKTTQTGIQYVEPRNKKVFGLFQLKQYLDVDTLLNRWVDLPFVDGRVVITDQADLANYLDKMFEILEDVYCWSSQSGSIRMHLACSTFLNAVLCNQFINFDFVGIEKTHDAVKGTKCAWFSDWLSSNREMEGAFSIIEKMKDSTYGWNEFGMTAIGTLLKDCNIQYAQDIITDNQYNKLKQLVLSLSSYRITIMDEVETGRSCDDTAAVVDDIILEKLETRDLIYFDPIGDSEFPPRVGGYTNDIWVSGDIVVPTTDLRRQEGKQYYIYTVKDAKFYSNPVVGDHLITPKLWPLASVKEVDEKIPLGDPKYGMPVEMVEIPRDPDDDWTDAVIPFKPFRKTTDKYVTGELTTEDEVQYTKYYVKNDATDGFLSVMIGVIAPVPAEGLTDLPEDVVKVEIDGVEMVYPIDSLGLYEEILVGERLPTGKCFEIVNLYDYLGLERGTPILISRDDKWRWYYSTGTPTEGTVSYPCGNTGTENFGEYQQADGTALPVEVTDDKFDLENSFSNSAVAQRLTSLVYRINVPTYGMSWSKPVRSIQLEKLLYPTSNHELILTETKELSLLIEENEYPEPPKEEE